MATPWTVFLILPLLVLAAAQGHSGQDVESEDQKDPSLVDALNDVSDALECYGDIMRSHTQMSENSLNGFADLPSVPLRTSSPKHDSWAEVERLQEKVDELTRENDAQKILLAAKDKQLQDLERRLNESQIRAQELAEQDKILNKTAPSQTEALEEEPACGPYQEDVAKQVEKYVEDGDADALRSGLEAALEDESPARGQVANVSSAYVSPLYEVAREGHVDLVKLLLCHALPVDTAGPNAYTMLHGAAYGGHLQLVQLLLHHGADVNSVDNLGRPAVLVAAVGAHLDVVQCLVRAGAGSISTDNAAGSASQEGDTPALQYHFQVA